MRKYLFFMVTAMWLFFVFIVGSSQAQSSEPKAEIVGQFSLLRPTLVSQFHEWRSGGGATVAYDLNKIISVDVGFLAFGKGKVLQSVGAMTIPQPEFQGLFGIKAGVKREKYGVFAKVRPGFSRLSAAQNCKGVDFTSCQDEHKNTFTADYGGVFEVYPARRFVVRVDVGAAYTAYSDRRIFRLGDPGFPNIIMTIDGKPAHIFQITMGAGFRF
jgi:hypothetical protein